MDLDGVLVEREPETTEEGNTKSGFQKALSFTDN
jgi:hypothetical protein